MPQDFYTLEQAAQRLGLSREKLTEMANRREVRAFMDRGTMRFRQSEIEELARRRGMGSDVELQLGDSSLEQPTAPAAPRSEDVFPFPIEGDSSDATEIFSAPSVKSAPGSDSDVRLVPQGSDVELTMDKPRKETKPPSSGRLNKGKSPTDSGSKLVPDSDSDVKLVDDSSVPIGQEDRSASDSDVRLEKGAGKLPDSGVRLVDDRPAGRGKKVDDTSPTDEINLDEELRRAEEASRSGHRKATAPFEIAGESSKKKKGGGDFDSSEEELSLDIGSDELVADDVTKAGETSGINLGKPSDRGVPLEDSSSEEALTFDLAVDDSDAGTTPKPRPRREAPVTEPDSSSEFELTLDDDGSLAPLDEDRKDAEGVVRTDMILPVHDEGEGSSEELSLQSDESSGGSSGDINLETSDFELALDEEGVAGEGDTGSEVIVIDEDAEEGESTAVKPQAVDELEAEEVDEVLEEGSEELTVEEAVEEEGVRAGPVQPVAVEAPPADWGWWSLIHLPTVLVLLFVGFLLLEMLQSIWGYHSPSAVGGQVYNMFQSVTK